MICSGWPSSSGAFLTPAEAGSGWLICIAFPRLTPGATILCPLRGLEHRTSAASRWLFQGPEGPCSLRKCDPPFSFAKANEKDGATAWISGVAPGRRKEAEAAWSAQAEPIEWAQLRAEWLRAESLGPEQHCRMALKERRAQ